MGRSDVGILNCIGSLGYHMKVVISPETVLLLSVLCYKRPEEILPFLIAYVLHETAHITMLHCIKHCIFHITFQGFGATILSPSLSYRETILCTAAGPLMNLLCGLLYSLCPHFALISIWVGIYNLLPFPFLDGGLILSSILHLRFPPEFVFFTVKYISVITGILILLLCFIFHASPVFILISAILIYRSCCLSQ